MISCPECKEPLGEDVTVCPFCRHRITDQERELINKALSEERRKESAEEEKRINDRGAKRMLWLVFTGALFLILIIASVVVLTPPVSGKPYADALLKGIMAVGGIGAAISVCLWVFTPVGRCPHCGKYLFNPFGSHCQWCGGRI